VSSGRSEEDLATLAAVRERVGDRVELRLDGMSHYDFETARNLCASQECEGLQFFLDPLDSPDLHRLASLGRQANVPMAAWRAIRGPADVMAAVRCGAAPYLLIDLEQVGGLGPARACAAVAEAAGVHPILGGQPSVGIAAAAMLQLAAAAPAFSGSNEIALCPLRDSVLVEPLSTIEGMMPVPQGPGLGVEVNRAKVEKCQAA
jgi:muconate cycloisomerase